MTETPDDAPPPVVEHDQEPDLPVDLLHQSFSDTLFALTLLRAG